LLARYRSFAASARNEIIMDPLLPWLGFAKEVEIFRRLEAPKVEIFEAMRWAQSSQ
jgi:hypothetical protein